MLYRFSLTRPVVTGWVMLAFTVATAAPPESSRPVAGIRDNTPRVHAITNLRIVVKPGEAIDGATLVLRDGLIEAVGKDAPVPADARVWDGTGKTAYAGFIDAYSEIDPPAVASDKASAHWNGQVTPQISAVENYSAPAALEQAVSRHRFRRPARRPE